MNTFLADAPALDYPEACRRIEALQAQEDDGINPLSRTIFLSHGRKTERALVLLHGYTSSPHMYRQVAEMLFAQGLNVLVPLAPLHGKMNRQDTAFAALNEKAALAYLKAMGDIVQGLGDRIGLAGFSMGGVLALWAARYRYDLDFVAVISPALSFRFIPSSLSFPVLRLLRSLPNRFVWWDPLLKSNGFPRSHGYLRFATHGIAMIGILGAWIRRRSLHSLPAARKVRFVLNHGDEALNNSCALEICRQWQSRDPARTDLHEFDAALHLPHDFIDPEQRRQQVTLVYPILLRLLTEGW